jgi:hypothetical protein
MTPLKRVFISLCITVVVLAGTVIAQDNVGGASLSAVLNGRELLSLTQWSVKGARLFCVVSRSKPKGEQVFDVYREDKDRLVSVFSKEGDLIVSMSPLSSYNGRFLVTWSGGSAYYFQVFAYADGRVRQVLDESSKLSPEILYDDQGRESILITEPRNEHGKWTSVHGTTRVFKWQEDRYRKVGTIPWEERFQCLSTQSAGGQHLRDARGCGGETSR